ncbi:hypothetical protein Tco_1412393 [Tanacetum coccineum]
MGWFWMGEDSFDERSMKSYLGIVLGGFWVEEIALEAMKMIINERTGMPDSIDLMEPAMLQMEPAAAALVSNFPKFLVEI